MEGTQNGLYNTILPLKPMRVWICWQSVWLLQKAMPSWGCQQPCRLLGNKWVGLSHPWQCIWWNENGCQCALIARDTDGLLWVQLWIGYQRRELLNWAWVWRVEEWAIKAIRLLSWHGWWPHILLWWWREQWSLVSWHFRRQHCHESGMHTQR